MSDARSVQRVENLDQIYAAARDLIAAADMGKGRYGNVTFAVVDGEPRDIEVNRRLRESDLNREPTEPMQFAQSKR